MTSEFQSWARVIFFRQLVIRVGALGIVRVEHRNLGTVNCPRWSR